MKFKYRRYYIYYCMRCLAFVATLIPLAVSRPLGAFGGMIAYLFLPRYRRITCANLALAFGATKTPAEIRAIALKVFANLGRNAAEFINFPKISPDTIDRYVTVEGLERLEEARAKGNGVIALAGHFGNWEIIPMYFKVKGYPGAVIARRIYFDKYDTFLNRLRKTHDVNAIYRDDSPKKILRVLKNNGIMGIVADQDVDSIDGVFVTFFGEKAYTPAGPVLLARVSGADILPIFILRNGRRHRIVIEKPVALVDTGDNKSDLITNTQRWSDVVESYIRRYPDHWVWMHRRWKTKESL